MDTKEAEEKAKLFLPVRDQVTDVEATAEDDDSKVVDTIESLCMNCQENGTTKLLLTKIPFFRDVILMSFFCDYCHFKNNEVQSAGEIQTHGINLSLKVEKVADMQRQIVKSDTAVVTIDEVDIEIPPGRGRLSNVEGIISETMDGLAQDQDRRKEQHPGLYEKIEEIIEKIKKMINGEILPFTITIDDASGNSMIEPPRGDSSRNYSRKNYERTPEQNASLGIAAGEVCADNFRVTDLAEDKSMEGVDILEGKMYTMPCNCPGCGKPAAMNMQMVKIPYFKQVIITAVVCMHCGYRTNEVKTGGEIPPFGRRITLQVKMLEDLKRDILKSETCLLKVPECGLEVTPGSMGGRFTTVEGLLTQVRDDLHSSIFDADAGGGDSMPEDQKNSWDQFFSTLNQAINVEMEYTIVMEDPLSNSYVQNYSAPEPDPQLQEEEYERTAEEEEDLGLTDMRTHLNEHGEYVKEEIVKDESTTGEKEEKVSEGQLSATPSGLDAEPK